MMHLSVVALKFEPISTVVEPGVASMDPSDVSVDVTSSLGSVDAVVVLIVVDDVSAAVPVDDIDIKVDVAVVVLMHPHIFRANPSVVFSTSGWYVLGLTLNLTWIPSTVSRLISH